MQDAKLLHVTDRLIINTYPVHINSKYACTHALTRTRVYSTQSILHR